MKKVLILEDEVNIRSFVVINLKRAGYEAIEAANGQEALDKLRDNPDIGVAILDVMLPDIDGFEVCRRIRATNKQMGIIMLTARTQEAEKVTGLRMGADDYVTKPFGIAELLARVAALDRRLSSAAVTAEVSYLEQIESGAITLNLRRRQMSKNGEPIELTQGEYHMMEYFFQNLQKPLERLDILRQVWGADYVGDDKVVDVNIRRLRMKVEEDASQPRHICTVWGKGYQWNG